VEQSNKFGLRKTSHWEELVTKSKLLKRNSTTERLATQSSYGASMAFITKANQIGQTTTR
jgi:hypothetical protein